MTSEGPLRYRQVRHSRDWSGLACGWLAMDVPTVCRAALRRASWNAGAGRLLLPRMQLPLSRSMDCCRPTQGALPAVPRRSVDGYHA